MTGSHPLGNNIEFHALTPNPNASSLARRDLIHTRLVFTLAQNIVHRQVEAKANKNPFTYLL
jgi:hypothetical protein